MGRWSTSYRACGACLAVLVMCCQAADSESSSQLTPTTSQPIVSEEDVVAYVGGEPISLRDVEAQIGELPEARRAAFRDVRRVRKLVDDLVRTRLMAKAARERGLLEHPRVQRVVEQAMITELLREEVDDSSNPGDVSPAAIDEYLANNPDELSRPPEVRVALLLVSTEEQARRLAAQAKSGDQARFGELVAEHSLDPSKVSGGELPFFAVDSTAHPKALVDAAFALSDVGDISGPIAVDEGFALVRLLERRAGYERPLEQVRPRIEKLLRERLRAERVDAFVQQLEAQQPIEVYESALNRVKVPTAP